MAKGLLSMRSSFSKSAGRGCDKVVVNTGKFPPGLLGLAKPGPNEAIVCYMGRGSRMTDQIFKKN